jgi:hypothetical protein
MIRGHALWLMPEEPVGLRAGAVVDDLARRYGGPRFLPHVTLVSGITLAVAEIRSRARVLARTLGPAAVRLGRAVSRPEYYKALLVEVEGGDLRDLHARAAAAMGVPYDPGYMPHLSLAYGDFAPAEKDAMLARVGRRWDERCTLDRLVAVSLEGPPPTWTPVLTEALVAR